MTYEYQYQMFKTNLRKQVMLKQKQYYVKTLNFLKNEFYFKKNCRSNAEWKNIEPSNVGVSRSSFVGLPGARSNRFYGATSGISTTWEDFGFLTSLG